MLMNSNSNQYPDMICISTHSRRTFRCDISGLKLKEYMQNVLDSNYFETRKMCALRIQVPNTVSIIKCFVNFPRIILETLWKRVFIIWKVLQFNKHLNS